MAQLPQMFDATTIDPTQGSPSFPVGRHLVVIVKDEQVENKSKDGGFLAMTMRIVEGPHAGFEGIGDRLNMWNSSQQAVEIAYRRLSAYCHVTGVYKIGATEQLHGIPFYGEWVPQNTEEGKAKGYTQLSKLYDRNGNEPGKQGQPAQTPAPNPQQPAAGGGWNVGSGNPSATAGGGWNGTQAGTGAPTGQPQQGASNPWANGGQQQQPNTQPTNTGPWGGPAGGQGTNPWKK